MPYFFKGAKDGRRVVDPDTVPPRPELPSPTEAPWAVT
jgi:hypothetical protein